MARKGSGGFLAGLVLGGAVGAALAVILGGAANPAVGIVALGGSATFVSVVGKDDHAATLQTLLTEKGITTHLLEDDSRPTTLKTRLLAEGGFVSAQHLARIDHLSRDPLSATLAESLLTQLATCAADHHILLVSDYKNGVVTPKVVEGLYTLRDQHNTALVVDSQGDLDRFRRFDLIKCNRAEAEAFLGQSLDNPDERPAALATIRDRCEAQSVVVTLGAEGIAWVNEQGYGSCRAPRADVYDVTGAGDTVTVREGESSGSDDGFDYWIEVRFVSGAACGAWTLELFGHDC